MIGVKVCLNSFTLFSNNVISEDIVGDMPTINVKDDSSEECIIHYPPNYRDPVTDENMNPFKLTLMDLAFADDDALADAPLIASSKFCFAILNYRNFFPGFKDSKTMNNSNENGLG
ncbi:hypothetical protein NEOKW01_2152 [Nematocida sp. AWRm80]|nr:hypothetical protein NEOKW01_2152 [Nematocida sp. AWRm80]